MTSLKKTKINWILILQAWAMAWVVIGHAPLLSVTNEMQLQPKYVGILYTLAYSFHMPLFMIVSGYLFQMSRIEKRMEYWRMVLDKLKRLGVPMAFFTFLAMVIKSLFKGDMDRPVTLNFTYYFKSLFNASSGPLAEMWFVQVLIIMFLLRPLWEITFKSKISILLTLIILTTFNICKFKLIPFFSFSLAAWMAIYFYIGMLLRKLTHNKTLVFKGDYLFIMLIFICGLWIGLLFGDLKISIVLAFLGIASSVLIALLLDQYIPSMFSTFRNYTYQIFLMGIFIQILVKILFSHGIISNYHIAYILCIAFGVYIPVLICIIAEKINNPIINLCLGLISRNNSD